MTTCIKSQVSEISKFLLLSASFIRKNGLLKLKSMNTRFDTSECKAVVEKQWKEVSKTLSFVAKHHCNAHDDVYLAVADYIELFAVDLSKRFDVKPGKKSEIQFSVKRGEKLLDAYQSLLPSTINKNIRVMLSSMDQPYCIHSFYVRELLCAMELFGSMMVTLCIKTPFQAYERVLASKMNVPGWFTKGHPIDMLVHDVEDLRNAKKIGLVAIYSEPDRCSTQAVVMGSHRVESKTLLVAAI